MFDCTRDKSEYTQGVWRSLDLHCSFHQGKMLDFQKEKNLKISNIKVRIYWKVYKFLDNYHASLPVLSDANKIKKRKVGMITFCMMTIALIQLIHRLAS